MKRKISGFLACLALALFIAAPAAAQDFGTSTDFGTGLGQAEEGSEEEAAKTYYDYMESALIQSGSGNYKAAIDDYNKAIELDDRQGEAYNNRAKAYFMEGDYVKALEDAKIAKEMGDEIDMDFYKGLNAIATRVVTDDFNVQAAEDNRRGNYDQAIDNYTKIIELDPNYPWANKNRSEMYFFKTDYLRAHMDIMESESRGYPVDWIMKKEIEDRLGIRHRR